MKFETVKISLTKDEPYCHGPNFCICHAGYLEPDDYCPIHGQYALNKCCKCGRFFSRENPKTCSRSRNETAALEGEK